MRGQPADDKQRPSGDMIRKQFIVFPVVSPLSPDLLVQCVVSALPMDLGSSLELF